MQIVGLMSYISWSIARYKNENTLCTDLKILGHAQTYHLIKNFTRFWATLTFWAPLRNLYTPYTANSSSTFRNTLSVQSSWIADPSSWYQYVLPKRRWGIATLRRVNSSAERRPRLFIVWSFKSCPFFVTVPVITTEWHFLRIFL